MGFGVEMDFEHIISDFMKHIIAGEIEVYNEFSLQHELGLFLRDRLTGYKVQFERNTKFFNISDTVKHEIDIVVFNDSEKYAIELKYPLNGQYPEQMYSFIKDIRFMEELKQAGFNGTYCLTLVQDKKFFSGAKQDGIYSYFRGKKPIHGIITKPTGRKDEQIQIEGNYSIEWMIEKDKAYYICRL